ncbi:hypothetical protein [Sandaracinobacteroides saxicola]|uniref:Uncharacterized protein n=1 Tax=Sandaracinobacteroides saxicola TaxID=2759707 RepID=A0A7G5IES6_9SPHN|nr:hypothetical protein [Sandaracinobacteroides saxicola]QMW21868.1 hypothetical protein H3309_10740 [Sandaracinobacteroides saxicola]
MQFREGVNEGLAASPVLGGGQTGAALSFTPDPLASAPFRIVARYSAAHNAKGSIDPATAEAALGLRWQIDPRLAIDIERRFAIGVLGRSTWAARISGGLSGSYRLFGRNATWDSYAEAGALGITRVSSYAGIQGRTGVPLLDLRSLSLDAGIGAWASGQQIYGLGNIGRIDLGPSLRLGSRSFPISGQLDYRWRAVGNVFPGSGPVFTVTGRF